MTEEVKEEKEKYLVEFKSAYYSVKTIILLISKYFNGNEKDPSTFTEEEAKDYLKNKGFKIIKIEDQKNETSPETIWISYDLGVRGDYEGLYKWLDNNKAKECGDSMAIIWKTIKGDIPTIITQELKENVELKNTDRIYIIYRDKEGKEKGKFIFGGRKRTQWEGYGQEISEEVDECE